MKRLLCMIMAVGFVVCGACKQPNTDEPSAEDNEKPTSTIEYCYLEAMTGDIKDIPQFMWKAQGVYPNEYVEKTEKQIDPLRCYRKNDDTIYAFEGWYYDAAYENKLTSNKINASIRGDITLYAKIVEREKRSEDIVTASIVYALDDFGLGQEGIESMTDGISLPTEYIEGEGTVLPKLKNWKQSAKVSYRFAGWYYDADFENKLTDETISEDQTGNLTVYPSIEIWVG